MTQPDEVMARRVEVRGLVQGVWFRASCRDVARRLGARGWVANCPDGSVAGHFEGSEQQVGALIDWCRTGPPGATVTDLAVERADPGGHCGFEIR